MNRVDSDVLYVETRPADTPWDAVPVAMDCGQDFRTDEKGRTSADDGAVEEELQAPEVAGVAARRSAGHLKREWRVEESIVARHVVSAFTNTAVLAATPFRRVG
jgi:hypothetical protein